jgi:hypothetical protein
MTHHFCTYFDRGYVSRALVLHDSLVATGIDFQLTALCLDDEAHNVVEGARAPTLQAVGLAELEAHDPALLDVKPSRSPHEYYFTLGPSLMRLLLDRDELDHLTYLDADTCFYDSPQALFDEAVDAATVIVGHRFPPRLAHLEETGRFNVAWVGFANDDDGRMCLSWWRDRCLDWCFDEIEPERYADQKYLDQFPVLFDRVHELGHTGADVAPWNLADPPLEWDGHRFMVGDQPLVFFHFQGLRQASRWIIDPNLAEYGNRTTPSIRRLYRGYVDALARKAAPPLSSPRRSQVNRPNVAREVVKNGLGLLRHELIAHRP